MNNDVFETWFDNKLLPNLPGDRNTLIELGNAKFYCRLVGKTPAVKMRKNGLIEFMKKYNITIPEPVPTKPILLSLIKEADVSK